MFLFSFILLIIISYNELYSYSWGQKYFSKLLLTENIMGSFKNEMQVIVHDYEEEQEDISILLKNTKTTKITKFYEERGLGNNLSLIGQLEIYDIHIKNSFIFNSQEQLSISYKNNVLYNKPFLGIKKFWEQPYQSFAMQIGITPVIIGYNVKGSFSSSELSSLEVLFSYGRNYSILNKNLYSEVAVKNKIYYDQTTALNAELTTGINLNSSWIVLFSFIMDINEKSYTPTYVLTDKATMHRFLRSSSNSVIRYNASKITDKIEEFSHSVTRYNLAQSRVGIMRKITENTAVYFSIFTPLNIDNSLKRSNFSLGLKYEL